MVGLVDNNLTALRLGRKAGSTTRAVFLCAFRGRALSASSPELGPGLSRDPGMLTEMPCSGDDGQQATGFPKGKVPA